MYSDRGGAWSPPRLDRWDGGSRPVSRANSGDLISPGPVQRRASLTDFGVWRTSRMITSGSFQRLNGGRPRRLSAHSASSSGLPLGYGSLPMPEPLRRSAYQLERGQNRQNTVRRTASTPLDDQARSLHSFSFSALDTQHLGLHRSGSAVASTNGSLTSLASPGAPTESAVLRNPNKALLTIDSTHTIVMANDAACELFGYGSGDIVGQPIRSLLAQPPSHRAGVSVLEKHLDVTGGEVAIAGKVIDGVRRDGSLVAVSVWLKRLNTKKGDPSRFIAILERVQRYTGTLLLVKEGHILYADSGAEDVFEVEPCDVINQPVTSLIPTIELPEHPPSKKMRMTGRTKEGTNFPLILRVGAPGPEDEAILHANGSGVGAGRLAYRVDIQVLHNMSGLVTFTSDGRIHSYNRQFVRLFFGYSKEALEGQPATFLLPHLNHDDDSLHPLGEEDHDHTPSDVHGSGVVLLEGSRRTKARHRDGALMNVLLHVTRVTTATGEAVFCAWISKDTGMGSGRLFGQMDSDLTLSRPGSIDQLLPWSRQTSTDCAVNRQGSDEPHQIRRMPSLDLAWDPPSDTQWASTQQPINSMQGANLNTQYTTNSTQHLYSVQPNIATMSNECHIAQSANSNNNSQWVNMNSQAADQFALAPAGPGGMQCWDGEEGQMAGQIGTMDEAEAGSDGRCSGLFERHYRILHSIGKGAFGLVQMATAKATATPVVVKFICKARVLSDCWTTNVSESLRKTIASERIPLEICILHQSLHPNIIRMVDVFENEEYFQLVMERHGPGLDLFEYIDENPGIPENVASFIFRQVVEAVSYLHQHNIIHRDVKDENIILDENFNVKLIDFGSAAIMEPGKLFSTFCGTLEYCAPEVLLGNKYPGPELEVWSMGVTLYTVVFGENPFYDIDETISGQLNPPFPASNVCMDLLSRMLCVDPLSRATLPQILRHPWLQPETHFQRMEPSYTSPPVPTYSQPQPYVHTQQPGMPLSQSRNEPDWELGESDCDTLASDLEDQLVL